MLDIARLANVSTPTVSRVLNGSALVNEEARERVLETARAYGYAVNRNTQKLMPANTVAVMLDFGSHRHGAIGDPFIFELLAGVSEALSGRNQDLLLSPPGLEEPVLSTIYIARGGADGFIALGQERETRCCARSRSRKFRSWYGALFLPTPAIARSAATILQAAPRRRAFHRASASPLAFRRRFPARGAAAAL